MPLTVRLDDDDYSNLTRTASELGMRPGTLARVLLHASLRKVATGPAEASITGALGALQTLADLASDLPPVDALAVARSARSELEARGGE
jgi:hypothetical protein